MNPAMTLLETCKRSGITLSPTPAGGLRYAGDKAALERLLPAIREHKLALLRLLTAATNQPASLDLGDMVEYYEERAGVLEHDFNTPKAEADKLAFERLIIRYQLRDANGNIPKTISVVMPPQGVSMEGLLARLSFEFGDRLVILAGGEHWTANQYGRRLALESGKAVVASKRGNADKVLVVWAEKNGLLVDITRNTQSRWANPFALQNHSDPAERDRVCDRFAEYLPTKPDLLARLGELKGRLLLCWCHPARCHGDHLARLANNGGKP